MTNIVVKFTVNAASKKKALKKVVEYVIPRRRIVGRNVVNSSFVRRRLNVISICNPSSIFPEMIGMF